MGDAKEESYASNRTGVRLTESKSRSSWKMCPFIQKDSEKEARNSVCKLGSGDGEPARAVGVCTWEKDACRRNLTQLHQC